MIQEEFVGLETAKLLKEKGFNVPTYDFYEFEYDQPVKKHSQRALPMNWNDDDDDTLSCPTQQMACRWLREAHNIIIDIRWSYNSKGFIDYQYSIYKVFPKPYYLVESERNEFWNSYESAIEEAIKYCLDNLI